MSRRFLSVMFQAQAELNTPDVHSDEKSELSYMAIGHLEKTQRSLKRLFPNY
ncbi:hypothetical protein LOY39_20685 [Pseudomonas rhodesiae]|uniref:hypothetical protein n=1 Tax=Pseudomonas TaxID=286 RepID=UPI001C7D2161|nr:MULTISPECIES: hypothetical protein [Pseudomonas]MBX4138539.1 hypothetical protein [Pseudomonas sp. S5F11]UVL08077.1 hypothetical protein LOY39_20685 [Pseudomonas rhodesiae]